MSLHDMLPPEVHPDLFPLREKIWTTWNHFARSEHDLAAAMCDAELLSRLFRPRKLVDEDVTKMLTLFAATFGHCRRITGSDIDLWMVDTLLLPFVALLGLGERRGKGELLKARGKGGADQYIDKITMETSASDSRIAEVLCRIGTGRDCHLLEGTMQHMLRLRVERG